MRSEPSDPTTTEEEETGLVREVPLSSLAIEGSRYESLRSPGGARRDREGFDVLASSLSVMGQLSPVIAHEAEPGSLHILDGFARARAARDLGWSHLACVVLARATAAERVLGLLLTVRHDQLAGNAVTRARFLGLAQSMGVSQDALHARLLPALGLQPHRRVLEQCAAVCALPATVLDFCAEKGFSLKQCVHLTRHSRALLDLVFSWRHRVGLTASLAEELCDDLSDYLRGQEISPTEFADRPDVRAVLGAGTTPQQAARELRDLVRSLRAPVLVGASQRMQAARDALRLPAHLRLSWDRSLERRELRLEIALRDPEEWPATLEVLKREQMRRGIAALFEDL